MASTVVSVKPCSWNSSRAASTIAARVRSMCRSRSPGMTPYRKASAPGPEAEAVAAGAVEAEDVGVDLVGDVAVEGGEHRPLDPHPVVVAGHLRGDHLGEGDG